MKTIKRGDALPSPRFSCIYFLIENNIVVYVGQSINLAGRVLDHKYTTKIEFDKIGFIPCEVEDMNNMEAINIVKHKPKYNFTLPTNDNFKTLAHLRNRVVNLLLTVKFKYSKKTNTTEIENQREHQYLSSNDCDDIISEFEKIIKAKFS